MKESEAIEKFWIILREFDFDVDEKLVTINFCENLCGGNLGVVDPVPIKYDIHLDKRLLTDPDKIESTWSALMAQFSANVVPSLPKEERFLLVFLHELGHIVYLHGIKGNDPENCEEEFQREEEAWDFAWHVYRAYNAGRAVQQKEL